MNQEIVDAWVERLRDGSTPQLRGYLGNDVGERCCLGVLCDLAVEAGIIEPPEIEERDHYEGRLIYDDRWGAPSKAVCIWAGVPDMDANRFDEGSEMHPLFRYAQLNDTHEMPFDEIADDIESTHTLVGTQALGVLEVT